MTPNTCVKCGSNTGTQEYLFQVPYGDPVMLLLGLLSYQLTKNVHEVNAYFCDQCWRKYRISRWIGPGIAIAFFLAIAVGLFCSAVYKTDDPISYLFVSAVVFAVSALVVKRFLRPHVILATKDAVKIDVPGAGIHTINMSNATGLVGLGLLDKNRDRQPPTGPN
jgi:hypothetical protein